jgi:predicted lipoprotein with Yx(FWY)xxD motif
MKSIQKFTALRTATIVFGVLSLAMTACASKSNTGSGSGGGGSGGTIATANIASVGTVLTDGQGMTLYYLKTDNASKVTCTGSCATTWPPSTVSGSVPAAGSGVTGTLGTIANPSGSKQLTYMGWPLYTYSGDSAPGQANGQGTGGVWFAMTSDGPTASGGSSSSSGSGHYGGY